MGACRSEKASVEELYTTRMLGLGYLQRNQLPEAEAEFKKLTESAPDDPFGYASLGLTYLQAGRYAEAEKELLRAREIDPSSAEVGLALAKVYSLTGRIADARSVLEKMRRDTTSSPRVLYALAELEMRSSDPVKAQRYQSLLNEALKVAPANLAVRFKLIEWFTRLLQSDSAVAQLEEVRRLPPEPPKEARIYLDSAIQLLLAHKNSEAQSVVRHFLNLMEATAPYQASLDQVKSPESAIAGRPVLTFEPKDFISLHGPREKAVTDLAKFVDATSESLPDRNSGLSSLAVGDIDGDGNDEVLIGTHLYHVQGGFFQAITKPTGISAQLDPAYATFADYDNDGWLDLFVIGRDGRGHLFHNDGKGSFTETTAKAGVTDVKGAAKALFVDFDHDGDLDLLLVGKKLTVYRNNLDGTFTASDIAGVSDVRDAVFGDFTGDGHIDLFLARDPGYDDLLSGPGFGDSPKPIGITESASSAAAVGDYNNDGFLDLFVASANGGGSLWLNKGNGTFARDSRSAAAMQAMRSTAATTAAFVDYDNDGWLDLVVGGKSLFLFRNDGSGKFLDKSTLIPSDVRAAGAKSLALADVDNDGDEDLLVMDHAGAPHLLRNDLGNSNLAMNVELKALRDGSGKNNALGIGSRIELRAGDIYQTRVATARVTHFGLGPHLKADVLRVEWPNGVPQTVYFPGSDQDVVERELLKGSCALAYTWDGKRFRFVTDAMWRSALGMPLGLMGGTSAFAPAGASQEYLRIPGDALKPRDGRYLLQLTEELWETAYADEVKLLTIDHPDSVDVFVDERFVPPGPVKLRVFQIAKRDYPLSAIDERGNDVLPALRKTDDIYVSNFTPTRYQGIVEPHEVVMDLGDAAGRDGALLFLRGWIYPTDASINVALGQQSSIKIASPSLEVRDASGRWKTAIANIGFPSGKDKTMIIALSGKFPTADHHVRIRTNMQIYWDEAFVARDLANGAAKITKLAPLSADLHYRGFSRMYRKGGRYGPYWFAYNDVETESPWRPIDGAFTRFGDVLSLLGKSDDMYMVMAAGDEATIQFDATSASALPSGWKRDFLLYTDGWIKDSDLNTAFGTTVGPLPFHRIRSYPYAAGDAYPTDAQHQNYLRQYETRLPKGNSQPSETYRRGDASKL
ncbi:MAG: FG-GAP-like repeat-containing protein [Gemmatimonadaceae bacterium]